LYSLLKNCNLLHQNDTRPPADNTALPPSSSHNHPLPPNNLPPHYTRHQPLLLQHSRTNLPQLANRSRRIPPRSIRQHLPPRMRLLPATRFRVGTAGSRCQGDHQNCVLGHGTGWGEASYIGGGEGDADDTDV